MSGFPLVLPPKPWLGGLRTSGPRGLRTGPCTARPSGRSLARLLARGPSGVQARPPLLRGVLRRVLREVSTPGALGSALEESPNRRRRGTIRRCPWGGRNRRRGSASLLRESPVSWGFLPGALRPPPLTGGLDASAAPGAGAGGVPGQRRLLGAGWGDGAVGEPEPQGAVGRHGFPRDCCFSRRALFALRS